MPFGDAHLKALGRITVEFSSLEHLLDAVIGLLIQHEFDEVGEILTAQLSFKRKVDVIDSLTRYRFEDEGLRKRMHGLLGEIIHAEEERNKIVHSWWFAKTPEGLLSRAKMSARRGKTSPAWWMLTSGPCNCRMGSGTASPAQRPAWMRRVSSVPAMDDWLRDRRAVRTGPSSSPMAPAQGS